MIDEGMREKIAGAIAQAEQGTRAEFVAAIARRADEYRSTALMFALAAALLAAIGIWVLAPWPAPGEIILGEMIAFILVYAALAWFSFAMPLVPAARKRRMAGRLARLVFLERGLASTEERCGVLLFVSEAERYVEILADRGIDQVVEAGAWQEIVVNFTETVGRGEVELGFLGAIQRLGELMARHYPPIGDNPNRIPDRLIEL